MTNPARRRQAAPRRPKMSKTEARVLLVLAGLGVCVLLSVLRVIVVGVVDGGDDEPEGRPSAVATASTTGTPAKGAAVPAATTPSPSPSVRVTTPAARQPKPPPRKPPPADEPTEEEEDEPAQDAYYANCSEVRAAGAAPLHRGEPGYRGALDRDGDGVACES